MITIEALQAMNQPEHIAITEHARLRLWERGITAEDIISSIASGEIIRQYEDDKPFPSCLLLGRNTGGRHIHVVVSHDDEFIYLITAYYPDLNVWQADLKTRKERP